MLQTFRFSRHVFAGVTYVALNTKATH